MAYQIRPGDVCEVETAIGLAYIQVTNHRFKMYGYAIRLIEGVYVGRPSEMSEIAQRNTKYYFFTPLQAIVRSRKHRYFHFVGNFALPHSEESPPAFLGIILGAGGTVRKWLVNAGDREIYETEKLSPREKKLSVLGLISPLLLREWIETGWTPEKEDFRNKSF